MNRSKSIAIVAVVTAGVIALWVFIYKKMLKPSDTITPEFPELPDYTGGLPDPRAPTSKDIERRASEIMDEPTDVWDAIDRYTRDREAESGKAIVTKEEPAQTTREESYTETQKYVPDPKVADVINQACPTVVWRVRYFDKDTRQWEIRWTKAVTSIEAIANVKPTVNGALFSADKTA